MWRFPFGRPVTPRGPSSRSRRSLFVLGAYPSALHVRWTPPSPFKLVRALAVDNEPTPFWNGADQASVVEQWKTGVGFHGGWGQVRADPEYNGPCGQDLVENLFAPLGIGPAEACITDCLDTYRGSVGGAKRIGDTYNPWALTAGLSEAVLPPHPNEAQIVREALASHRARLLGELAVARPDLIVTLGNAALRVMRELVAHQAVPARLTLADYGQERQARVAGRLVRWLPLAHPAAPARYLAQHRAWAASYSPKG